MTDRPSAAARALDVAALALVAGGGALYVAAHAGMKEILATQVHVATIEAPNITRWVHYRSMSNIGLALVAGGIAVAVTAYLRSRRPPPPATGTLPDALPDAVPITPPNVPRE